MDSFTRDTSWLRRDWRSCETSTRRAHSVCVRECCASASTPCRSVWARKSAHPEWRSTVRDARRSTCRRRSATTSMARTSGAPSPTSSWWSTPTSSPRPSKPDTCRRSTVSRSTAGRALSTSWSRRRRKSPTTRRRSSRRSNRGTTRARSKRNAEWSIVRTATLPYFLHISLCTSLSQSLRASAGRLARAKYNYMLSAKIK